jgi:hypothetical protein
VFLARYVWAFFGVMVSMVASIAAMALFSCSVHRAYQARAQTLSTVLADVK